MSNFEGFIFNLTLVTGFNRKRIPIEWQTQISQSANRTSFWSQCSRAAFATNYCGRQTSDVSLKKYLPLRDTSLVLSLNYIVLWRTFIVGSGSSSDGVWQSDRDSQLILNVLMGPVPLTADWTHWVHFILSNTRQISHVNSLFDDLTITSIFLWPDWRPLWEV